MKNKRLIIILSSAATLLLIPLIAMQFTSEVDWDIADFVIMGAMLLVTGILIELVLRNIHDFKFRVIFCGAILLAFFFIWAELATGFFGHQLEVLMTSN